MTPTTHSTRTLLSSISLLALCAAVGCADPASDTAAPTDTNPTDDTGTADTGTLDTGPTDTGTTDTGTTDTGTTDTGTTDTGTTDTGTTDTGTEDGAAPLYGYWGLNGYTSASGLADVKSRLGMTVFQVACSEPGYCIDTVLPMVEAAGLKVTFRLTPSAEVYTTSGNFDLEIWKDELARWSSSDVQHYIDNGTLVGHMILDDIQNFSGRDATAADLDEMARYSKELFPGLMTYVRERATEMPLPSSGRYVYVDACVNQYQSNHGEVHEYAAEQEAQALSLGLGTINGLNIADGGDGSSGQAGWRSGFHAMSAAEITEYGNVLAAVPSMGMFLNWEYDGQEAWSDGTIGDTYFNQPAFQTALADLAIVVGNHAPVTLLKP
jgi:hypothetical protein